jgi:hypothetical protein
VRYAGASGDFNIIHWNDRAARSVGLPGVIAHGMYTMAQASRYVTEWAGGDPGAVTEFGVRFSAMVPVPDDVPPLGASTGGASTGGASTGGGSTGGATIEVSGTVAEKLGDNKVAVNLVARADGTKVLNRARAVVRLR